MFMAHSNIPFNEAADKAAKESAVMFPHPMLRLSFKFKSVIFGRKDGISPPPHSEPFFPPIKTGCFKINATHP